LEKDRDYLSKKAQQILKFVESRPLRECNTYSLALSLNISESHFRKEFKRHLKINFREFKKRLFAHYETVLLFEKKLKPGDIFKILDYKNISAFSRSFKMRHGDSWQSMVRDYN
jgi:AraC-like DNA-binding protein